MSFYFINIMEHSTERILSQIVTILTLSSMYTNWYIHASICAYNNTEIYAISAIWIVSGFVINVHSKSDMPSFGSYPHVEKLVNANILFLGDSWDWKLSMIYFHTYAYWITYWEQFWHIFEENRVGKFSEYLIMNEIHFKSVLFYLKIPYLSKSKLQNHNLCFCKLIPDCILFFYAWYMV